MTQGFDEWFDKEYSNYGNSYKKTYDEKHDIYGSQFVDERYDAYKAGQQSKQAEIDGQFIANCKQTDHIHKLQREKDELQKRIDVALDHAVNHGGYDDLTHIINILKGDQL